MPEGSEGAGNQQTGHDGGNAGKTFTQEQLDAVIAERLGREREKYKDYEALKTAAGELEQIKQAQMTQTQKLEAQLDILAKENAGLKTAAGLHQAERAATKAGALYPDLVAAKVPAEVVGDEKKLAAALAEIKTAYPALFGSRAAGSADGGAGGGKAAGASMNDFIRRAAGRA